MYIKVGQKLLLCTIAGVPTFLQSSQRIPNLPDMRHTQRNACRIAGLSDCLPKTPCAFRRKSPTSIAFRSS